MENTRTCKKCEGVKPFEAFAFRSKSKTRVYRKYVCKQCDAVQRLQRFNRSKHEPGVMERKRNYQRKCYKKTQTLGSDGRAWRHLRLILKRRGLELDQFHARFESQDFSCAICGDELVLGGKRGAHVDHCHVTGKVRGILCARCNLGIGNFRDDPSHMVTASQYINKWRTA